MYPANNDNAPSYDNNTDPTAPPPPSYEQSCRAGGQGQGGYYDLELTFESVDLARRINDERSKVTSCRNWFRRHFGLLLFVIFVITITAPALYSFYQSLGSESKDVPKPGTFGTKCILFPQYLGADSTFNENEMQVSNISTNKNKSDLYKTNSNSVKVKCDSSLNLECNEDSLTCKCAPGMYFDHPRSTCLSFAGGQCSNFNGFKPCTQHSYCYQENNTSPGMCICEKFYTQVSNGLCLLEFGHFGCSKTSDCNTFEFLTCMESGMCDCDIRNSQNWNEVRRLCTTLVGGHCSLTKQCIDNSSCSDQRCVCNQNYKQTSNRLCALDYGQPCIHDDDCHSTYICSSVKNQKYCLCRPSEIFRDGKCIALPGKHCIPNINECDKNSQCEHASGFCTCTQGYSQVKTDACLANYGIQCNSNSNPCNYEAYLLCDDDTGLCDCQPGYMFNSYIGKCDRVHVPTSGSPQAYPNPSGIFCIVSIFQFFGIFSHKS